MKIKFKLTAANFPVRMETRKVQGRNASGDYLVHYNGGPGFIVHPAEVEKVFYEAGDTVHGSEITAADILKEYKEGRLSYDMAFKELVNEHCLSAGNATEMLNDQKERC